MAAAIALALAFGAGFWLGRGQPMGQERPSVATTRAVPVLADSCEGCSPATTLVQARDWAALDAWTVANARAIRAGALADERAKLLPELGRAAATGARREAGRWLESYLELVPADADAALLLADLYAAAGMPRRALPWLFAVSAVADETVAAVLARRIDRLVEDHARTLAERDAQGEVLTFYEELSLVQPHDDRYRVGAVRALLALGELDRAERLLAETGNAGVEEATLEGLRDELEFARTGLPIARRGALLVAEVLVNGRPVTMMVDTGATHSALTTDRLRRVGARREGPRVRVQTAGGVIEAPRYVLDHLGVAGRVFQGFEVLALDELPPGVDGLLGVDVLDRIVWVGLPGG
jgi:clan AA aspartic protease (TIGR02281 family)